MPRKSAKKTPGGGPGTSVAAGVKSTMTNPLGGRLAKRPAKAAGRSGRR